MEGDGECAAQKAPVQGASHPLQVLKQAVERKKPPDDYIADPDALFPLLANHDRDLELGLRDISGSFPLLSICWNQDMET